MKSKSTTIILCLFLGGIGVHMFYLDRNLSGLMRFIFCWTLMPAFIALLEVFQFALMSEETFNRRYNSVAIAMNALERSKKGESPADTLQKLADLFSKGLLTKEEFEAKKIDLLSKIGA